MKHLFSKNDVKEDFPVPSGICDSKNKNELAKNTQLASINNQNISNAIQTNNQNVASKLEQNINSNTKFITTNNAISGTEQNEINKQISQFLEDNDKPSDVDRHCSMGSSVSNEDSIGYNQTRNTVAN